MNNTTAEDTVLHNHGEYNKFNSAKRFNHQAIWLLRESSTVFGHGYQEEAATVLRYRFSNGFFFHVHALFFRIVFKRSSCVRHMANARVALAEKHFALLLGSHRLFCWFHISAVLRCSRAVLAIWPIGKILPDCVHAFLFKLAFQWDFFPNSDGY